MGGHGETTVFGLHAVTALLQANPGTVSALYLDGRRRDRRMHDLAQLAGAAEVPVSLRDGRELDRLAGGGRHQGVVARVRAAEPRSEAWLEELLTSSSVPPFLLVLDQVQDPHNLGACLRSADAAGAHAVVVPRDRACGLTVTARKVASGAAEAVPFVQVTNLARTLKMLRHAGVRVVGADGSADGTAFDVDLTGPLALVLGAEGKGLRRLTRENCDQLIRIPMAGSVASLNVSVAAGVLLFEAVRQRGADGDRT